MKRWLCVIGLALSLGCASAVVRPYVGDQQAWPTASGSIVNMNYALPVFTSLPPASYNVLAEMRISSPFYAQPEEHHMPLLVQRAKQLGADALVFVQGRIFFSTNYGPRSGAAPDTGEQKVPTLTTVNTFNPNSFATEVTILAVRWTDEAPPGLPSHSKTAAGAMLSGAGSAPVTTEAAPQTQSTGTATNTVQQPQPAQTSPASASPADSQKEATSPSPTNSPPAAPVAQ